MKNLTDNKKDLEWPFWMNMASRYGSPLSIEVTPNLWRNLTFDNIWSGILATLENKINNGGRHNSKNDET